MQILKILSQNLISFYQQTHPPVLQVLKHPVIHIYFKALKMWRWLFDLFIDLTSDHSLCFHSAEPGITGKYCIWFWRTHVKLVNSNTETTSSYNSNPDIRCRCDLQQSSPPCEACSRWDHRPGVLEQRPLPPQTADQDQFRSSVTR